MKRILVLLAVLVLPVVGSTSAFGQDDLEKIKELADTDSVHVPALLQAVLQGETETVQTLIKEGEDVNEYWDYREDDPHLYIGYTPLEVATILGNLDIMRLLLDNGAETERIYSGYPYEVPALVYADDVEVAQLLLDRGANAKSWVAETPLLAVLVENGVNINMIKLLIDHGANVDTYGELGITPLHGAKNAEIAQLLIDHGANVQGYCCDTPLHTAEDAEIAKLLIDHGANVNANAHGETGDTPLLSAVRNDKKDIVKILIDHGADVNAKDNAGRTPLDIAIDRGKDEIAALLREHGGVATE